MEKEERIEKILQEYRNKGVEIKYSLLMIDSNTNESSYKCEWYTEEQVKKFIASFKPDEIRNITIVGMSNLRFADASLGNMNNRVFHEGVATSPTGKK